jgi:hypothetical protein
LKIDPKGLAPFDDNSEYDDWYDAVVDGQGPYAEPIDIKLVASAAYECVLCVAECLIPVLSSDVVAEGIAQ